MTRRSYTEIQDLVKQFKAAGEPCAAKATRSYDRTPHELLSEMTIENGVVRNSIGRVAPQDMLDAFHELRLIDNETFGKSSVTRKDEDRAALDRYVAARENMSDEARAEELFEMRAAFGPGETVVNILTGERTKL